MPKLPNPSFPIQAASSANNVPLPVFQTSDNPEWIELLITGKTGTSGENSLQKFQSILRKTPKIGTTSKAEFFTYAVMGAFTVLPNTQLMDKLTIKHIYIHPVHSSKGILTVKLALQLEKVGKKYLQLYTFASTQEISGSQHWKLEELQEVIAQLEITQTELENYKLDDKLQLKGKIYHIDQTFTLSETELKIGSGKNLAQYKELASAFQDLIKPVPLSKPDTNNEQFKKIIQLTEQRIDPIDGQQKTFPRFNLELSFAKLSSHADLKGIIDDIEREVKLNEIAQAVASAGRDIFSDLAQIYRHWQPKLELGTAEVHSHGYCTGVLEQLFKYRYALDIAIEKILGLGRADVTFVSRLDGLANKNWEAIPIAAEFKAGQESPAQGLQQIGDRGYLHHTPRMRTLSTRGVALGVNFAFPEPVASVVKNIKVEPTNFIKTLLEVGDGVVQSGITHDLNNRIEAAVNNLYYSIVTSNGANDNSNYLSRMLLGQTIGLAAPSLSADFASIDGDTLLCFKKTGLVIAVYVFNTGLNTDNSQLVSPLMNSFKKKLDHWLKEHSLENMDRYVELLIYNKNPPSIESLKTETIEDLLKNYPNNNVLSHHASIPPDLLAISSFNFLNDQGELAIEEMGNSLFSKRDLIRSESDVQAIVQGALLATGQLQVFTESNHLLGGRADIVASPIDRGNNKRIKVIELKYAESHRQAKLLQIKALEQLKKYTINLKSFSDGREVDLVALTYDAQSRQAKKLFLYKKVTEKIVHTSGSEYVPPSPKYRDVFGDKSPPYFQAHPNNLGKQNVVILPVAEILPFGAAANAQGMKTPPWQSPNPGYIADIETSPEKKGSGASDVGNIEGIVAGLRSTPPLTHIINLITSKGEAADKVVVEKAVNELIIAGIDINESINPEGFSLLHLAVIHCKPLIVKALLSIGKADLLLTDEEGLTALHMVAAYRNHREQLQQSEEMKKEKETAQIIIEYSHVINRQDHHGNTPLHTAAINGNSYVVQLLLEKDYLFPQQKLLSIKNSLDRTVLHEVAANAQQGIKTLALLMDVASQQDLEEKNADAKTPLQMVDRLIEKRTLLKKELPLLFSELTGFVEELNSTPKTETSQAYLAKFKDLINKITILRTQIKELPLDILNSFNGIFRLYVHFIANPIESKQLNLKLNSLKASFRTQLNEFASSNAIYVNGLNEISEVLLQDNYNSWKSNILSKASSFVDYQKSLPNASLLSEQIRLADAHYTSGLDYQNLDDYANAQFHLEQSKTLYLNLQAYPQLEKTYQALVEIQIAQSNIYYEQEQLAILADTQQSDKEKLCAHLALANFYKLNRLRFSHSKISNQLKQDLSFYESYHYSLAYDLMQGAVDPDAHLVLQREMGVSTQNIKLGTANIQQCVAVFAYCHTQKKLVLAHFDRFSGPLTFRKKLFSQFSKDDKLDIYVCGGRDRSDNGQVISDNNINQVLKQLYHQVQEDRAQMTIHAMSVGQADAPSAVVFDPALGTLVHRVAQHPDASLNFRAARMNLRINKMGEVDYLYPLEINYYPIDNDQKIQFTSEEQQYLIKLYQDYHNQASQEQSYNAWYHNQILYPLLCALDTTSTQNHFHEPVFHFKHFQSDWQNNHAQIKRISSLPLSLPFDRDFEPSLDLVSMINDQYPTDHVVTHSSSNQFKRPSETSLHSGNKRARLQAISPPSFEEATETGDFHYWLTQEDIADIARLDFNSFTTADNSEFEIIGSQEHLANQLQNFKNKVIQQASHARLSLIMNLNDNHWVTLIVQYHQNTWRAFYVDSMSKTEIPAMVRTSLNSFAIKIYNLSHGRQRDSTNCGLWALEAAVLVNQQLDNHPNWQGALWEGILNQKEFSVDFFKQQREHYATLLRNDFQRIIRQADWLDNIPQIQTCGIRRRRNIGSCSSTINRHDRHSERLALLQEAENWHHSLINVLPKQAGWIPILASAREEANGEQLTFYNRYTEEEQTILLPEKKNSQFRKKLRSVYKNLYVALKFIVRNPEQAAQILFGLKHGMPPELLSDISSMENSEAIDGLNVAFTLKALIAAVQQKNRASLSLTEQNPLSLALKVHTTVNLLQMVHGTTLDGVKLVGLVKTLLRQENVMQKPLSAFRIGFKSAAVEGVGTLLSVISVGLDINELEQASTSAEKALFGTQLAFDSGSFVLTASSIGATLLGASEVAAGLSSGGVIFAGLGIGITGLVQAFNQIVDKAEKVGTYFYQIDDAYKKLGYKIVADPNQAVMSPRFGAVISEIDFQNASISYASQFIYRSRPRSRGVFGSGKDNFISWSGDMPTIVPNKTQALNIRQRLGYLPRAPLGNWTSYSTWILPYTPISYIRYGWSSLPGTTTRNDNGFSVLRKLEEKEDFDYDFYIVPSEYTISEVFEEKITTSITIRLDTQVRNLIIPQFSIADSELSRYLHYVIEANELPGGACSLYLNKVAAIQLKERHANYTWVLNAEGLSDDTLTFTSTGISIGDILIEIPQHQAEYLFIDKTGTATFLLDFNQTNAILTSLNYKKIQQDYFSLQNYLKNHTLFNLENLSNPVVVLSHFDLQDEYKINYQGKAYYSAAAHRFFYTNNIPQRLNDGSNLIHFTQDSAYFFNAELDFLWHADNQHELMENYIFLREFTTHSNSSLQAKAIVAISEENDTLKVIQPFVNPANITQRHVIYYILANRPLVDSVQDDELLRSLHVYAILLSSYQTDSEKKLYQEALQKLCLNSLFNATSYTDPNPKLSGSAAYTEFKPNLAITPFSPASPLTPIWVRRNKNHDCQLINPRLFQKEIIYLGSSFTPLQQEIFFFFKPPYKKAPGQLYRQTEGEFRAIALDLTLTAAFFMENNLLAFTLDGIVLKIDASGRSHILSFTKEWINTQPNWWHVIPLCLAKTPAAEVHLPVFGIIDQTGNALAVWYDTQYQDFVLATPPLKAKGQQFHMTYLGRLANKHFFYSENKIVYSQTVDPSLMNTLFQAAQLQHPISPLSALATAERVYLHQQKVWITTETGLLFSFTPQKPEQWFLEKIYFQWMHKIKSSMQYYNPLRHTNFASIIQNEAQYLHYCFSNWFKTENGNFFIPKEISMQEAQFNFSNLSLIPIESKLHTTMLWWRPQQNQFFSVPAEKNGGEWVFLAEAAQHHYFFSAKEKIIYAIAADTMMSSTKAYQTLPADLALRTHNTLLLLLRTPNPYFTTIPLFKGVEVLELDISLSESLAFTLILTNDVMQHYQTIAYKTSLTGNSSITEGELDSILFNFSEASADKFFVFKSEQDMVISHSQYPCKLILVNAMTLTASTRMTTIQFAYKRIKKTEIKLFDIKKQLALGMENISLWPLSAASENINRLTKPVIQSDKNSNLTIPTRSKRALSGAQKIEEATLDYYDVYERQQVKQAPSKGKTKTKRAIVTQNNPVNHAHKHPPVTKKPCNRPMANRGQKSIKIKESLAQNQSQNGGPVVSVFKQEKPQQIANARHTILPIKTNKVTSSKFFKSSIDNRQERSINDRLMQIDHRSEQPQSNPTKLGISRVTEQVNLPNTLMLMRLLLPKQSRRPALNKKMQRFIDIKSEQKIPGQAPALNISIGK